MLFYVPEPLRDKRLWPALSSLALVASGWVVLAMLFQCQLQLSAVAADLGINLILAYWLYVLLRSAWLAVGVQALLTGMLYLGFGFKLYYFAEPLALDDMHAVPVLVTQEPIWVRAAILLPLTALLLLLAFGLRRRWQTVLWLAAGMAIVAIPLVAFPGLVSRSVDTALGYKAYAQVGDFKARGPYLYLMDEYMRDRATQGSPPGRQEVAQTLAAMGLTQRFPLVPVVAKPRDIYVIMMETLWDPSLLTASHLSADPLAPGFRQLYEQADHSQVMVPVFGGGTPNSEFEALCGQPVYDTRIVFLSDMNQEVSCLPRILAAAGYHTYAATAIDYGVWNRGVAFRALGFERFYDSDNYQADDLNGQFLSDESLFDQTDSLLQREAAPGPRFTYICTGSGHHPFLLDPKRRPAFITSDAAPIVTAYANVVYYDTEELAAYIARLRSRDPDAVIVAFGDHLPALGSGLHAYAHSHLMRMSRDQFTPAMLETHQSTPILVIDGSRGPLKLGRLSLFELPRLLLSLIGAQAPTELDAFAPPVGLHPRPYGGSLLMVPDAGQPEFCQPKPQDDRCAQVDRWYQQTTLLRTDVMTGADYTHLILYGAKPASRTDAMDYLSSTKAQHVGHD